MPQWATACVLNVAFLAMYTIAFYRLDAKPSSYVASACTSAILLSMVLALFILVRQIVTAKNGEVAHAISKGAVTSLNLSWAITCISLLCYIGWSPVSAFIGNNIGMVISTLGAFAIVGAGYFFASPSSTSEVTTQHGGQSLAVPQGFQPTLAQQPSFQVTMADMTRLVSHQAGRAIGYAGSNVLFDDSFSLELDVNERVARVYSNTNLIHSHEFMYWRLHMLMMGSAAEMVLLGSSSQAAVDDLTNFDDLASKYLTLRMDRTFNATPINLHEAQIKASRIAMLRKSVYDRCNAACLQNRNTLTDLVKLMRARNVLTYGDIRVHLERVKMPDGFPVARFDDTDILQKALLAFDEHQEVTLEGTFQEGTGLEQAEAFQDAQAEQDSVRPMSQTENTDQRDQVADVADSRLTA
ncbi:hypothetical protein GIW05_00305 [Pseudomonas syringae]|nr:hypothetical protein [Pseudomonas syringae]MCF5381963.1 hypothetical protein [Pseudomonas syringae]